MAAHHQLSSSPDNVRLPTGEKMSNGAYLFADEGPDSLGQISKAINDLFNWFRPSIVHDRPRGDAGANPFWFTTSSSDDLVAQYEVPAWISGVGGASARQDVIATVDMEVESGTGTVTVDVVTSQGTHSGVLTTTSTTFSEQQQTWAIHDGDEILRVDVKLKGPGQSQKVVVRELRLDWVPRTDNLLSIDSSGRYGGEWRNPFLPCDAGHLRSDYATGSVERVRRMLIDVRELLIRRTPQMIVTWSDLNNPLYRSGNHDPEVIVRLATPHLPHATHVEVRMLCKGSLRVKVGPWQKSVAASDWSWRRMLIPVDRETDPERTLRQFRIFCDDGLGSAEPNLKSLSAWWRILA